MHEEVRTTVHYAENTVGSERIKTSKSMNVYDDRYSEDETSECNVAVAYYDLTAVKRIDVSLESDIKLLYKVSNPVGEH